MFYLKTLRKFNIYLNEEIFQDIRNQRKDT